MQYMQDNLWIHTIYCCRSVDGGFQWVPHSNQNANSNWILPWNIETLVLLETKGLRGWWVDWLVWSLTTIIARHYMHMAEMKKRGFIKNKVVEHIVQVNVEKATLIPHTNVTHGINDSNQTGHAWMVLKPTTSEYDIQSPTSFHQVCLLHMWMSIVWKLIQT